ncbi:MAG: metallophosphoesterase [Candidatus Thermoplasmatota archaeon]|nr:metallophosphoesterase [Candidatus Thermoplasmatota archaeon]
MPEKEQPNGQGLLPVLVFLSIVLAVLLAMGGIVSTAVHLLYELPWSFPVLLAAFSLVEVMVLASMILSSRGYHLLLKPLNVASMLLLAGSFYGVVASVPVYLFMIADAVLGAGPSLHQLMRIAYPTMIMAPILWGILEARALRSKRIGIPTKKTFAKGLRIAFASDVHMGVIVGRRRMEEIARRILSFEPDVIILGGDVYDTSPRNIPWAREVLTRLSRAAPTFFVTGNHEAFHDLKDILEEISSMSITALRGQSVRVRGVPLTLHGMDDPTDMRMGKADLTLPENIRGTDDSYHVFAYHRPLMFPEAAVKGIDLQISGHTHAGQIFPFNLATRLAFGRYHRGVHRLGPSYLYTSNGAATWGPPIRFLAPPEVVLIEVTG